MRASRPAAADRPAVQPVRSQRDTSFDSLPGIRAMKTQAAAGQLLGLANPFHRLHEVRAGSRTVIEGRDFLNFASYDYLGLNGDPRIGAAVAAAAAEWGTSVSASRLTAGERPFHQAFETALADIYETEAALAFVSGHATNVSAISALMGPKDLIVHDALAHNSIVVGAEATKAHRRLFPHNDIEALDALLAANRDAYERVLIVTEGLFSMDGDTPDLAALIAVKERWGCWLMIDEAHSLGVLGATGRGLFEDRGIDPARVDIWMGTLSKTLCSCGGYIAGPRPLIDFLRFQAAGMVYSVGLAPPATAAAHTALTLMRAEPERVARLQANSRRFLETARAAGLDTGTGEGHAVMPVIVGDSIRTVFLADRLFKRGINAFPIIPPGVPEKTARLRFFLSSAHTFDDIDRAVAATAEELTRLVADNISVATLATLAAGGPAPRP